MWNRIKYHIAKWFLGFYQPRMIYYKKDFQNKPIHNLRIGNTTFIDGSDQLLLGNNVYIGHHNFIEASHKITIHEGCQITSFVSITSHSSHISIRLYGNNFGSVTNHIGYRVGEISIGKFTFIGPHSTVMPGTTIGEGSIVAAYSYVKGDFPPFSIIAGNPAKVVGDTRHLDEKYLKEYPELDQYYMK